MMNLFDVYSVWPIEPVKAQGCYIWDKNGTKYLDMYGGHAVISVGHCHPHYVDSITNQLDKISFYSNSVINSLQNRLASKLGEISGYSNFSLFLSNSGAEANENAIKIASFHTKKRKFISFGGSFHGRTVGAVSLTDNPAIWSNYNCNNDVTIIKDFCVDSVEMALKTGDYAGVIIEPIQGVAGIVVPHKEFLNQLRSLTTSYGALLIIDEVQSGYGRSGRFFAHQYSGITPDIITVAKGMANGFPIGGTLISPSISPSKGMLGTTFGGNHLACAAAISVLEIIEQESLVTNAYNMGSYLKEQLVNIKNNYPAVIADVRGEGLMIGVEFMSGFEQVRDLILQDKKIFVGSAKKNVMRLLPPLSIDKSIVDHFIVCFNDLIVKTTN